MSKKKRSKKKCFESINAINDALYVLNGKWKIMVIKALNEGPKRFSELERCIDGISPKALSKELKELELNEIVFRKVYNTIPVKIIYELTPYSDSLKEIIDCLGDWGLQHKEYIFKKGNR